MKAVDRLSLQVADGEFMVFVESATAVRLVSGGARFDVGILDMDMPGIDGQVLASALREVPAGRNLPMILLSSLQNRLEPEHRGVFVAALTKPVKAQLPAHRQPRIAAMTASALVEDRTACAAAGMDGYLAKPVRSEELAALLAHRAPTPAPVA